ncbi:DUF7283 family protein [Halapricum desulfuricans]|uniref:Putative pilin/flagellin n=1 Tax=Halapricum desulfuricans TaxID=2841257 RepID=A0A897MRY6_9EURY|nr:hypothetical protein [Halapricum desulfuricans]QSG04900.1 putative pilin/flagellin [Halapricum desulfuricans]
MDLEAPADAWYVWVGVALVSVAAIGIALGLPSGPPPDAHAAANAVDRVAGSAHEATGTYEHDARSYWVDRERIAMRNEHGVTKATLAYGPVVPVEEDTELAAVLHGNSIAIAYTSQLRPSKPSQEQFHEDVEEAIAAVDSADPQWRSADGTLRVRAVEYELGGGEQRVVLLAM